MVAYKITDNITGEVLMTTDVSHETFEALFPEAPEEVEEAIDELVEELSRGECTGGTWGWEVYLGLSVERVYDYDPMAGALWDYDDMPGITVLDHAEDGTLYNLHMDLFDMDISVFVTAEGDMEYFPNDWDGLQPKSCEDLRDMANFHWVEGEEYAYQ
jgi:hypothetical protein